MSVYWMGLDSGLSALRAFQQSLNVVQHNVANADTEGYSRQRAVLVDIPPASYEPYGGIGRGVMLANVEQLRSSYLDTNIRKETQTSGKWETLESIYSQIEVIFGEPEETAFSSVMEKFWNSWQNVANDPMDMSYRSVLRENASTMAAAFNQIHTRLAQLQTYTDQEIQSKVNAINSYAREIAQLNDQIHKIQFEGIVANDLVDQRELLIDKLNKIIPATTSQNQDGTVNVYLNGEALVMSNRAYELMTVPREDGTGFVDIQWERINTTVTPRNGELAALFQMRDTTIPGYSDQIDMLAAGIINEVNAAHRTGMGLDGSTSITGAKDFTGTLAANSTIQLNGTDISLFAGDDLATIVQRINNEEAATGVHAAVSGSRLVLSNTATDGRCIDVTADPDSVMFTLGIVNNFFTGTGADDIAVDPAIINDLNKIAVSASGAPGDTVVADQIMALRDAQTMMDDTVTFDSYYNAIIADLGVNTEEAIQANKSQGIVIDQLEEMRQSVSGVSIDEELTKMLQYQRGYEAAAKFIGVVDGLLDVLINGII